MSVRFKIWLWLAAAMVAGTPCAQALTLQEKVKLEADYLVACQYFHPGDPTHGAINNVFSVTDDPTWVVPRENALAILGLIEASRILHDPAYRQRAELAADYLVRVQDQTDGAWFDQYDHVTKALNSKSPTQTAEVMMAFYALGYRASRAAAMRKGAQFLLAAQNPANKLGSDDGLLGGGKDAQGNWHTFRWTSDNAFAYQALRAAEAWAMAEGDVPASQQRAVDAQRVLDGINAKLRVFSVQDPDYGVWRRVIDRFGQPVDAFLHEWINYAPQMIDVPATGTGSPAVGDWIHAKFQQADGAVVWDDTYFTNRKSPGFSFQAALAWFDLGQPAYANAAIAWAENSGLWQTTPDANGRIGGWVDWTENGTPAPFWQRFIDTSFYAIAAWSRGYDFRITTWFGTSTPFPPTLVDLDGDGAQEILEVHAQLSGISAFRPSGQPVPGWPVTQCEPSGSLANVSLPAVADLDGDGKPEIAGVASSSSRWGVCVVEHDGTVKWWKDLPAAAGGTVAISNLDGLDRPELIVSGAQLTVLDADGSIQLGWPNFASASVQGFAVGDLDGDGGEDIAFVGSNAVYAADRFANLLPGWPVNVSGVRGSPALGDLDGDGRLDVVATTQTSVYAWDRQGAILPGWPVTIQFTPIGNNPVILANVDGDPAAEVALGTSSNGIPPNNSYLHILDGNGSGIAQVGLGAYYPGDTPIAGNFDASDATDEVIAVNEGGTAVIWPPRAGWPKQVSFPNSFYTPALGDINGDGNLEVVAPTQGALHILLTDGLASAQPQHWATYAADTARTGRYRSTQPANRPPVLAPPGNKTVAEGQTLAFTLSATDPDGDTLTYSASPLPPGATLSASTGAFSWTPGFNRSGSYSTTFSVSDGRLTSSKTSVMTVTNVPLQITSLTDSVDPFSPNGDGRRDTTAVQAQFNHKVTNSKLTIQNGSGTTVRSFSGSNASSFTWTWNGKDSSGARVPDGTYTYTLTGTDDGWTTSVSRTGTVRVDTTVPTVTGFGDSPDPFKPSTGQTTTIRFTLSEPATVSLKVYNSAGTLVRTLLNNILRTTLSNSVVWNGKNGSGALVPAGVYTYKLWVDDPAGNRASPYPRTGTVTVQ